VSKNVSDSKDSIIAANLDIVSDQQRYLKRLLDSESFERSLKRISHEILEANKGAEKLVLVGLANGGIEISKLIGSNISSIENIVVPKFILNVTKYRDDTATRFEKSTLPTDIDITIDKMNVVLVDDVLFTGRTVRAAFQALLDYGRPANVKLAVLIDRGHREFPIRPDFVGKNLPTSLSEQVTVIDGEVWLEKSNV
jgi:pyrimidine operon attenuation protein/uracil phosphoribosyltransferase